MIARKDNHRRGGRRTIAAGPGTLGIAMQDMSRSKAGIHDFLPACCKELWMAPRARHDDRARPASQSAGGLV